MSDRRSDAYVDPLTSQRKHSISGAMSCGMALAALLVWGVTVPGNYLGGKVSLAALMLQWSAVLTFCIVGIGLGVQGVVRRRRHKLLPLLGLFLNPLAIAIFLGYWWWPTPDSLVAAAAAGDLPGVHTALAMGVPINAPGHQGLRDSDPDARLTALEAAAQFGRTEVVQDLLARGANVNAAPQGRTPLFLAVQASKADTVKILLDHKADPAIAAPDGTPLQVAAHAGKMDIIELLLAHGAAADPPGGAPLHEAAGMGHADVIRLLLDHGAKVDEPDSRGRTALHLAAASGAPEAVRELLDHKANLDAADAEGLTPLAQALDHGQNAIADELATRGAKIDLFTAIARGDALKLNELLQARPADVSTTRRGRTPLHEAVRLEAADMVQLLLSYKADANMASTDAARVTPLQLAVQEGNAKICGMLLDRGADPDAVARRAQGGNPPLYAAVVNGHLEVVKALLDHGADANALCSAPGIDGLPLYFAVAGKNLDIAAALLDHNAHVDGRKNADSPTPLYEAVRQPNVEMVQLLISHGANVDLPVAGGTVRALARERRGSDPENYEKISDLLDHAAKP